MKHSIFSGVSWKARRNEAVFSDASAVWGIFRCLSFREQLECRAFFRLVWVVPVFSNMWRRKDHPTQGLSVGIQLQPDFGGIEGLQWRGVPPMEWLAGVGSLLRFLWDGTKDSNTNLLEGRRMWGGVNADYRMHGTKMHRRKLGRMASVSYDSMIQLQWGF